MDFFKKGEFGKKNSSRKHENERDFKAGDERRNRRRRLDKESKKRQYSRGKTIAGSTFSRLHRLEEDAIKSATSREKIHRLSNLRRKIVTIFFVTVFLAIILLFLIWQFTSSVRISVVNADNIKDVSRYKKSINDYLKSNPMQRFRFSTNVKNLQNYIISKDSEVQSVDQVGFAGFGVTKFNITIRRPVASWQIGETKYYVDRQGLSFKKDFFDKPVISIVDDSGIKSNDTKAIVSDRFLSFVGRVLDISEKNGQKVTKVSIPRGKTRQIEINYDGVNYPILLSISNPPGSQIENAIRAIKYFAGKGETPKYIDVRVPQKVFYIN